MLFAIRDIEVDSEQDHHQASNDQINGNNKDRNCYPTANQNKVPKNTKQKFDVYVYTATRYVEGHKYR